MGSWCALMNLCLAACHYGGVAALLPTRMDRKNLAFMLTRVFTTGMMTSKRRTVRTLVRIGSMMERLGLIEMTRWHDMTFTTKYEFKNDGAVGWVRDKNSPVQR